MEDISLHVLDISQNSVSAGARQITISVREDTAENLLTVSITDDGGGIDPGILSTVTDPFTTTRITRKVGLGLAFLESACRSVGGDLEVTSDSDGTCVSATFRLVHVDRPPLGDMGSTLIVLLAANPEIRIVYVHEVNGKRFSFDSDEVAELLEDVDVRSPLVLRWLSRYLNDNLELLREGLDDRCHTSLDDVLLRHTMADVHQGEAHCKGRGWCPTQGRWDAKGWGEEEGE